MGRQFWFESDPDAPGNFWLHRGYRGGGLLPFRSPVNRLLIQAGAARRAAGVWRHPEVLDESLARRARKGVWGKPCRGSFTPRRSVAPSPRPAAPAPAPAPARPSRPARSDIYNCDDFPLPDGTTAQQYLALYPDDPSGLDGNNDGQACE